MSVAIQWAALWKDAEAAEKQAVADEQEAQGAYAQMVTTPFRSGSTVAGVHRKTKEATLGR